MEACNPKPLLNGPDKRGHEEIGRDSKTRADTKTDTKPDTDMTDIYTLVFFLLKDFMFRVYMRREFTYIASVFFVIVTSIVFVIIAISWCT